MKINLSDLHDEHRLVKASRAMAKAYLQHSSMMSAVNEVSQHHTDIDSYDLIVMWLGIHEFEQQRLNAS